MVNNVLIVFQTTTKD